MKPSSRLFLFLFLALLAPAPARGADAAAIAEQQEREERYKQLRTDLEEVMTAQALLQKKVQALTEEIRALRDEKPKLPPDMATRDDLKILAEKIQEVDKKRDADNQKILGELQKLVRTPPSPVIEPKARETPLPSGAATDKGFEYEVKSGDNLEAIVKAYRKAG